MTMEMLYEVPDSAAGRFRTCTTLDDWYDALNDLDLENCPSLDTEEALVSWAYFLPSNSPLGALFTDSLSAPPCTNGTHPVFRYASSAMVSAAADELAQLSKSALETRLGVAANESWLQPYLMQFLSSATSNGNGVVLIYGG